MSMILKGVLALFWLAVLPPALSGLFPGPASLPERYLKGYLLVFSLAELLTLPALFVRFPFHVLAAAYGGCLLAAAAAGAWRIRKAGGRPAFKKPVSSGFSLWMALALLLILAQILTVMALGHRDQDDAFYVATAATTLHNDSIFAVNPYTGYAYYHLPKRYILSPFPIFTACICKLCGSLHPAILGHVFFPGVFLALAYMVLSLLAGRWYPESPRLRGLFLLFSAVLIWFSAGSSYRSEVFLLVRSWQGKAVLAGVMLPYLFYRNLCWFYPGVPVASRVEGPAASWLSLFLTHLSCCLLSSMGIMLAPLMTGIFLVRFLGGACLGGKKARNKGGDPAGTGPEVGKRAAGALLAMLPCILLGAVYLRL